MEREMFGYLFRYEDGILFKQRKGGGKWTCCNDLRPHVGYNQLRLNGKNMLLHRLVYLFHHPEWDISDSSRDNSIDHINGNTLDNRIDNLRVVNNSQNQQNITHYGGKPIKGVCFYKNSNIWGANWHENEIRKIKFFRTEAEALEYRAEMVALHYTHAPRKEIDHTDIFSKSQ